MKTRTLFMLSALVVIASCNDKHERRNKEKNDWVDTVINKETGPVQQREFNGDFDEIQVSQAIDAEIIKSETEKVVISAPQSIIDEILVDNEGGKLHIHYKPGIRVMNINKVTAKIYAKDFTKLIAGSAAKIEVKDKFTQEKTDVEISSAGSVSGNLEANDLEINANSSSNFTGKIWAVNLDVDASSGASIDISGKAKHADISSSSGSSISAKDVIADNVDVEASSGANVHISAVSSVRAEASSGGSVDIIKKGELKTVTKEESSGGSVSIQ
ncbi:head GIN domain-containing protein [Chryseobacterium flavum]|uniref:head GIN domain-containing protein n=1 Tax=Chryseobacterium flavum TaxID=415851 RepID=UPI0028A7D85C|nr:head GIN domain-containing protein [Chryseobacterium flavum]